MYLIVIFQITLLLAFNFSIGQNSFFEKKYGDLAPDLARAVVQLPDSTIYILGTTVFSNNAQVSLTKTDKFGNLKWTKYYGDSLNDYGINFILSNNQLIIAYEKETTPNNLDIGILITDTSGTIITTLLYGLISKNESPRQIIKTIDNSYVICGFKSDDFNYNDLYVLKLDENFNFIWDLNIGGTDNDYSGGLVELPDSSLLIVGDTRSFSIGGYDIYLVKIDKNGNIIWDKTFGDTFDNGIQGIIKTQDQNIFIFGETHTGVALDFDFYTLLVDYNGNQIWQYNLGGTGTDAAFSAIELNNGDFILTGYSNSNDVNMPIDLTVFKIDRTGSINWQQYFGEQGIDIGYQITSSLNDGLLVVGQSYDTLFDTQQYLLHLSINGSFSKVNNTIKILNSYLPYPNPFIDYLIIPENYKDYPIQIFNYLGELILIEQIDNKIYFKGEITSGIYFLKIELNKSEYKTFRVIKQK